MKISNIAIALSFAGVMNAQAQMPPMATSQANVLTQSAYAITTRDGNSQTWQRTAYESGPDGKAVPRLHQYVELATGLNYKNASGQWAASDETIAILPDGTAAATNGQHQAYFPNDIYNGEIELVTPDGKVLQSRPAGLSYDDGSNTVMIAVLTNSIGQLVSSNQIVYPHAFVGINADLRYTYRKSGFEQDVVLREQPPMPSSLGLNPNTTKLQVLTEFFNPPKPRITTSNFKQGQVEDDVDLSFGSMSMVPGKAFSIRDDNNSIRGAHVKKSWAKIQDRQFLVESVSTADIGDDLESLPTPTTQTKINIPSPMLAGRLILPPQHLAETQSDAKPIYLAKNDSAVSGLVLDYNTVNSGLTNFTFQGDTTYYISGTVDLYGTNTFEGGTVIKYAASSAASIMAEYGSLVKWGASAYRPVVLTAVDDNTVGETISGSSGNPTGYYGGQCLYLALATNSDLVLQDLRMSYLTWGLGFYDYCPSVIRDAQFVACQAAIGSISNSCRMENVLVQGGANVFFGTFNATCENITFHNVTNLLQAYASVSASFTNSLVVGVNTNRATISGTGNAFLSSDTGIFQTVGGGNCYLATNSIYHNAGTANIDPFLLADLAMKTTYPPIAYTNVTFSTAQIFSPQAQRDNIGNPDLGYHYDPLDYTFGGCTANSNLTFTAGTAIGWFRTASGWEDAGYGITLANQQVAAFHGAATSPDYWVRLNTVQENDKTAGYGPGGLEGRAGSIAQSPQIQANFLKSYMMAAEGGNFWRDDYGYLIVQAQNSEFGSGGMGGYAMSLYLTNCLFDRCQIGQASGSTGNAMPVINSTFHGGLIYLNTSAAIPVSIINCALDGTTVNCTGYAANSSYATYNYNAYTNSSNPFPLGGASDVHVSGSFNWKSSWFGNYYQPTNSLLINKGSTTADQVGLYAFTILTNQVPEVNSIVDIGYHYIAADTNGNPFFPIQSLPPLPGGISGGTPANSSNVLNGVSYCPGGGGLGFYICATAAAADGKVYFGGDLTLVGQTSAVYNEQYSIYESFTPNPGIAIANGIATWDSKLSGWSPLMENNNPMMYNGVFSAYYAYDYGYTRVNSILVGSDNNVYVGGIFDACSGSGFPGTPSGIQSANAIAVWNPVNYTWSGLGSGLTTTVIDQWGYTNTTPGILTGMVEVDNMIYVVGQFNHAGGIVATNIAAWDMIHSNWVNVGVAPFINVVGYSSFPSCIATYGTNIFVGGQADNIWPGGNIQVPAVGFAWGNLSGGQINWKTIAISNNISSGVNAVTVTADGRVFAGGNFYGGLPKSFPAQINSLIEFNISSNAFFKPVIPGPAGNNFEFDGSIYSMIAISSSISNTISVTSTNSVTSNNTLIFGGAFNLFFQLPTLPAWTGLTAYSVAGYDLNSSNFFVLGPGNNTGTYGEESSVWALAAAPPSIYAGGDFNIINSIANPITNIDNVTGLNMNTNIWFPLK